MWISVIPAEAELRRIRARVTEVAWMIRALSKLRADEHPELHLTLVESWPDHQVRSLAAVLVGNQQFESREATLAAIRAVMEERS